MVVVALFRWKPSIAPVPRDATPSRVCRPTCHRGTTLLPGRECGGAKPHTPTAPRKQHVPAPLGPHMSLPAQCLVCPPTPVCFELLRSDRRLTTVRQPIRIVLDTSAVDAAPLLSASQRTVLLQNMLPTAVQRITAALKVDPVVGPLLASPPCRSRYSGQSPLAGKCSEYLTTLPQCSSSPPISIPERLLGSNCTDYSNVRAALAVPSVCCACVPLCWTLRPGQCTLCSLW